MATSTAQTWSFAGKLTLLVAAVIAVLVTVLVMAAR
jgi:hypothetical protein